MAIDRVAPASVAEEVSLILREAWPLPVLHYSPAYLAWQFSFPGVAAQGFLAREEGEPAAFIGVTPRRFRFRDAETDGYLLSFVSVRPQFRGRGLAGQLYAEQMRALRASGLPTVVFVESHAPAAQHLLFRAAEREGMKLKRLAPCQNHGFVPRASAAPPPAVAVEAEDVDEARDVLLSCSGDQVLWAAPARAQLEHHLKDPRGRKLLVVQESGRAVGAALAFLSEVATTKGLDRVPTVDALFLPEPTGPRLAAVLRATAEAFGGSASVPVVSAPSVATIPPDALKAAGLRKTGAAYDAFVVYGGEHPCLDAQSTNLEVV